jgi:hypothetical protein
MDLQRQESENSKQKLNILKNKENKIMKLFYELER